MSAAEENPLCEKGNFIYALHKWSLTFPTVCLVCGAPLPKTAAELP